MIEAIKNRKIKIRKGPDRRGAKKSLLLDPKLLFQADHP